MGIRLHEVKPILGMSQRATRELARFLCRSRSQAEQISAEQFSEAIHDFDDSGVGDHFLSSSGLSPNDVQRSLLDVGWIDETPSRVGFVLKQNLLYAESSVDGPRMTFEEATAQIMSLRDRLNRGSTSIEGITLHALVLYGSTLRDHNSQPTIGDLDLIADFSFDHRYDGKSDSERAEAGHREWDKTINNGDERVGFHVGVENARHMFDSAEDVKDSLGYSRVLLRIWRNEAAPASSSLTEVERTNLVTVEARTIRNGRRAQQLHNIIMTDRPVRPSGRMSSQADAELHA